MILQTYIRNPRKAPVGLELVAGLGVDPGHGAMPSIAANRSNEDSCAATQISFTGPSRTEIYPPELVCMRHPCAAWHAAGSTTADALCV